MHTKQEAMQAKMMGHMEMGKESMAQCPMMKEMKGMDENQEPLTNITRDDC
jgi:hypothetical protein